MLLNKVTLGKVESTYSTLRTLSQGLPQDLLTRHSQVSQKIVPSRTILALFEHGIV